MKVINRPEFPSFPASQLDKSPVTSYKKSPKVGGAPVVFSAQATLAAGKTAVLNAQTLQSGFRTSYLIDEIRISMVTNRIDPVAVGANRGFTGLSGLVSVLFQTGKYQFSADAVPVGLLAPMFGQDYGTVLVGDSANGDFRNFAAVRWMLPKPLYMAAGDVVLANVSLENLPLLTTIFGSEACVTVTVTYVGRIIPQGYVSNTRDIPWLAWWQKNMSTSYENSRTRLRNPFLVPAHVQRFTQRTYVSVPTTPTGLRRFAEEAALVQLYNSGAYETIKIGDSRGYAITNKFVAVGDVFDVSRHAWTFGRELTEREQFDMTIKTENFAAVVNTDTITNVGLVGYRSEAP